MIIQPAHDPIPNPRELSWKVFLGCRFCLGSCCAMITSFPDRHQNLRIPVAFGSTRSLHIRDLLGGSKSTAAFRRLNAHIKHCWLGIWSVLLAQWATSDHCRGKPSQCRSQLKAVAECQFGRRDLNATRKTSTVNFSHPSINNTLKLGDVEVLL